MKFNEKTKYLEQLLVESGEKKAWGSPPLYKLFWKFGWEIPPPLFQSFKMNFLCFGGYFGIFWGTTMYFFFWRKDEGNDLTINIAAAILAGVLFGVSMAWCFVNINAAIKYMN